VTLFPLGSRLFLIQLQINKHYSSVNPVANKHTLQLCCLWIRFVSQGVVCFHSVDFGGHTLDSQYAPRFFVDNLRQDSQVLARLHTKQVISHFFLHWTSVTRQCTGTLSTHHCALSWWFADWVSIFLSMDSIC
jgi:hypothetical protein